MIKQIEPFVLVSEEDFETAQLADIDVPVAVLVEEGGDFRIYCNGSLVPQHISIIYLLGLAVFSKSSQRIIQDYQKSFMDRFDSAHRPMLNLSSIPAGAHKERIHSWVISILSTDRAALARRNVALARDLAQLRIAQEQTQAAFSDLEKFANQTIGIKRASAVVLEVVNEIPTLTLQNGEALEQRLPSDSVGLSDVAVYVKEARLDSSSSLTAILTTAEDGTTAAVWCITGEQLSQGWLRLALPISLGSDPRTPNLHLSWNGPEGIQLGCSVRHPDPRFQSRLGGKPTGRVLALKVWKSVAGCQSNAPSNSILPTHVVSASAQRDDKRVIPEEVLADAVNMNPQNEHFRFISDLGALLVHPMPHTVTAGLLPQAVNKGAKHVSVRIETIAAQAPDVEYAIGVAVQGERRRKGASIPNFGEGLATAWHGLSARAESELHLYFETPLEHAHDLYLMTKLPEGSDNNSWAWATFSKISLDL